MKDTFPPGPRGNTLVGVMHELRADIMAFFERTRRAYGDFVHYRVGPAHVYQITDPELIRAVLQEHYDKTTKTWYVRQMHMLMGNGLMLNEGEPWRVQRKKIAPAFHHERIKRCAQVIDTLAKDMLSHWADGQVRNLHADMSGITLRVVYKSILGLDAEQAADDHRAVGLFLRQFEKLLAMRIPLPLAVPTLGNLQARAAARKMRRNVQRYLHEKRRAGAGGDDLLSWLLSAQEDGAMPEQQIIDEVMTLILAGHETTANVLAWTLMVLAQRPEIVAKLRHEAGLQWGAQSGELNQIPKLEYAKAVLQETMRLYTPAWMLARAVIAPFALGAYTIGKGTRVIIPTFLVHRDARWYPDPDAFRPERWEGAAADNIPKFAYLPFGGGPRVCVGNAFAMLEAQIILANIVQRFDLVLDPSKGIEIQASLTMRPRNGIWATVKALSLPA